MRSAQLTFRDASGVFYYDRWQAAVESAANLALSIALVKLLPAEHAVAGVIAATVVTSLLICYIVEPHILFKYGFMRPAAGFCVKKYAYIAVFDYSGVAEPPNPMN